MSRTRRRAQATTKITQVTQFLDQVPETGYVFLVDREVTEDEEHPWYAWRDLLKDLASQGRSLLVEMGGDFTSAKSQVRFIKPVPVSLRYWPYQGDYLYKYVGPLVPGFLSYHGVSSDVKGIPWDEFNPKDRISSKDYGLSELDWASIDTSEEELMQLGAKLVSSLSPTAPHNSVFTSLGELRNDGLPSVPFLSFLKGKDKDWIRNAGSEHLNYQFGIAPTISDVKKIHETIKNADKLLKQYSRDSGRLVRRRYDMDPETTTTTEVRVPTSTEVPLGTLQQHWSSVGPVTITTTTTRKRSFSAAYLYYVDEASLGGMTGWLEKADYLYGWKPDPSAVYNLTAWSWLLDWFTNTGDVIDNISLYLEDPFLVRWAYVMEHTHVVRSYRQHLVTNEGASVDIEVQLKLDLKKRRRVNPFHFGFKDEALTGHQLGILAALGATKGRNPGSM